MRDEAVSDEDLMADYYRCNDAVVDEIYRRYQIPLLVFFRRGGFRNTTPRTG